MYISDIKSLVIATQCDLHIDIN